MAKKGKEKNTKNKAKHTKLMTRKKNKLRTDKEMRKERLYTIVKKSQEDQSNQEDQSKI
ncbi:hypothetical protein [Formosa sp. PL04]|uniref:hypothetical protein n=1 Tax=Formosa sp. PL04 TaxID=3081755 RepID=UPI002981C070|nr:hypothetical protein [Formosa sp. PL04]MDW5288317.1 hypothetical protein [Formosa sp. PL04]